MKYSFGILLMSVSDSIVVGILLTYHSSGQTLKRLTDGVGVGDGVREGVGVGVGVGCSTTGPDFLEKTK